MKKWGLFVVLLALSTLAASQAPPDLPGYSVQITGGYSLLTGAQTSNGFFTEAAVPFHTFHDTNSVTVSGKADYFQVASPASNVIAAGPEVRFQFSKANFINGQVFQPFAHAEFGAARASGDTKTAWVIGGGLDMPDGQSLTWRIFEVDYVHSTLFPNNAVAESNWAQVKTALGIRF
jgi:hypothetical protein